MNVKLAFFSPTNTTREVLQGIARGLAAGSVDEWELTQPLPEDREFEAKEEDLVLIGAPVYAGRIPPEATARLRRLCGSGTPAVVVAVYGNRDYDDALLELRDLASENGFVPIAGAAFIGEHTANYAIEAEVPPVALCRPDEADAEKAFAFGQAISRKLEDIKKVKEQEPVEVPGSYPYKELKNRGEVDPPETREPVCTRCGDCAALCPTGAIAVGDRVETDGTLCILCLACVKYCPTGARVGDSTRMKRLGEWLSAEHRARKEPETYM
jgi:ferredoxin